MTMTLEKCLQDALEARRQNTVTLAPKSAAPTIQDRHNSYAENHCWQYDIRLKNYIEDLTEAGFTEEYISSLRVSDFEFSEVTSPEGKRILQKFIERHEWLGNISQYTTNWFACHHKGMLAGVILFNMPNAFSKMLGEDTKNLERLISRGACISWSPKNLASNFLMFCIRSMVATTKYRLFTAYSDPTARELGTIYQACNFYYLGQSSGTATRYINPYTGKVVSDRFFRQRTAYKKYAKELGISWEKNWTHPTGMDWKNIPDEVEKKLRDFSKTKQQGAEKIVMPSKHKYALVMGRSKSETKSLRKLFETRNKTFAYPKER